ncbi:MAG TPA: hypothetical protein EYP10_07010, partial [Armatimonadetes bacterium]|nr:hypothetical protein [Armatimonadota bacterium]
MLAVQYLGKGDIAVREYPDPIPGDGEVLVRLEVSAICGSELSAVLQDEPSEFNGGHEAVGVVADASRSKRWRDGDRVGVYAVWGCGHCEWCHRGVYTFCANRSSCPGLHAQYVVAPDHVLLPIPDDVDTASGVLLSGDGFGTPYHAGSRMNLRGGDIVAIVGCGPVGLGCILFHAHRGARVIALDIRPERLQYAREMGAEWLVNPAETDAIAAVSEITNGTMADGAMEVTGKPDGFALALKLVGKAGVVACVGENRNVTVNIGELIRSDITLFGSWYYHRYEYWEMVRMYRRGLQVSKLISHQFPLTKAQDAFREFAEGKTAK